jgi:hypothetical protein
MQWVVMVMCLEQNGVILVVLILTAGGIAPPIANTIT